MTAFDEWVDSLPVALGDRPHVVYIAWMNDIPLYVGMTCDLDRRIRGHHSSLASGWTTGYTHIDFTNVPNRAAAERLERQVILDLQPTGNRWKPQPYMLELTYDELVAADREAADRLSADLFAARRRLESVKSA